MYGLENPEEMSFFVGTEILHVCLGPYDVTLSLLKGPQKITFSIWNAFRCLPDEDLVLVSAKQHLKKSEKLTQFLEVPVTEVLANKDGTLRLGFADGRALEVYDDPRYESYSISWDENGPLII